jgi:hypothetical protein
MNIEIKNMEEKDMKYKVGDRVRVINMDGFDLYGIYNAEEYIGCVGEIIRNYGQGIHINVIKFDDTKIEAMDKRNGTLIFSDSNLELVVKKSAQEMANMATNTTYEGLVKLFESLGFDKSPKNPYEEFCTAKEILDSGIKLEKDMKILITNNIMETPFRRHLGDIDN